VTCPPEGSEIPSIYIKLILESGSIIDFMFEHEDEATITNILVFLHNATINSEFLREALVSEKEGKKILRSTFMLIKQKAEDYSSDEEESE
jgi:hypothetical protein